MIARTSAKKASRRPAASASTVRPPASRMRVSIRSPTTYSSTRTSTVRSWTCGGGAFGSSTSIREMRARSSCIALSRIESNTAAFDSKYR